MDLVQTHKIRTRTVNYPLYGIEIEKEGRILRYRVAKKKENESSMLDCKNKNLSKRARDYLLLLRSYDEKFYSSQPLLCKKLALLGL